MTRYSVFVLKMLLNTNEPTFDHCCSCLPLGMVFKPLVRPVPRGEGKFVVMGLLSCCWWYAMYALPQVLVQVLMKSALIMCVCASAVWHQMS